MNRARWKHKGRSESGGFFKLPFAVMDSPNYRKLSGSAVKLLTALGRQYLGNNNGNLSAAWRIMQKRGWRSRDTLQRAIRELLDAGMIEKTRQGGMHECSLFALTWHAIDECDGKINVPATRVASGLWKVPAENQSASTESVSIKPGIRVDSTMVA
jgi:hypothetical protein